MAYLMRQGAKGLLGNDLMSSLTHTASRSPERENSFQSKRLPAIVVPSLYPHAFYDGLSLVNQQITLPGYELYAVEQWLLDRDRQLSAIVVFTGDPKDIILVDVFEAESEDRDAWENACAALRRDGARSKQTPLGLLHITSITSVPPELTIAKLPSPAALLPPHLTHLYINVNIRRMGAGSRSSLTLGEATAAQQDKLLAIYSLHPVPSYAAFASSVLGLVGLVQEALSLFGIGPFANDLAEEISNEKNIGKAHPDNIVGTTSGPDGLLCESTTEGLSRWVIEYGEPLLKLYQEPNDANRLSPTIIAALLTVVYATRQRLEALGSKHVPRDPFLHRRRFLRAFHMFRSSSANGVFLDVSGIAHIRHQYHLRVTSDTFRVKKALKSRLEDLSTLSNHAQEEAKDEELTSLTSMVKTVRRGWMAEVDEVQLLWQGKTTTKRKRRTYRWLTGDRDDELGPAGDETSETEAEAPGRGKKLIRDVRGKAGRAGRAIGGGIGLIERTSSRPIAEESDAEMSALSASKIKRPLLAERRATRESHILSSQMDLSIATSRSESSSALDLTQYRPKAEQMDRLDNFAPRLAPQNRHKHFERPLLRKRNVTEHFELEMHSEDESEDLVESTPQDEVEEKDLFLDNESTRLVRHPHHRKHKQRRSFTSLDMLNDVKALDAKEKLRSDMALHAAYFDLYQKRQRLRDIVAALRIIDQSYEQALEKITEPIMNRSSQLFDLRQSAQKHSALIQDPSSSGHPAAIKDRLVVAVTAAIYSKDEVSAAVENLTSQVKAHKTDYEEGRKALERLQNSISMSLWIRTTRYGGQLWELLLKAKDWPSLWAGGAATAKE